MAMAASNKLEQLAQAQITAQASLAYSAIF